MIHNRKIAFGFRLVSFILAIYGLILNSNILNGSVTFAPFMYYTIQSNLLAAVMFGILTVRTWKGLQRAGTRGPAGYYPRFEMVCVIDILLTLIVYWAMLVPQTFAMQGEFSLWTADNLTVHMITPLLCLIDYILFTDAGHLKYRDVYMVLIYPLFYVVFSSSAGLLGYVYRLSEADGRAVRFPYFFYDFDEIGMKSFVYVVGLIVFFLILSHLFYLIDKKVPKRVLL